MSFRPNHNFNAITLYSEKNEIKSYWEKLSEVHVCANCDRHFNLLTSMGKLILFGNFPSPFPQEKRTFFCP
mgnify:CR=1 FL=1